MTKLEKLRMYLPSVPSATPLAQLISPRLLAAREI